MSAEHAFVRRLLTGFAWASGSSWAIKGIGVVVTLLMLAALSLAEFGTYQVVLAAWGLLSILFLQGIDQVVIAVGARAHAEKDASVVRELASGVFWFKMVPAAALAALSWFALDLLSPWYNGTILGYVQILSLTFLVIPLERVINYILSVRQEFFLVSLFLLVEEGLKALGVIASLFLLADPLIGVMWSFVGAAALTTLLFLPIVGRDAFSAIAQMHMRRFVWISLGIGKWNVMQKYVRQAEKNLRPFLVQYFLNLEAVAIFAIAEKLFTHLITLISLESVLVPSISSELSNTQRLQKLLERGFKYSFAVLSALALVALVALPLLLYLFFPEYLASLPLVFVLLVYVPFSGMASILTSFFSSHQEQKEFFFLVLKRFALFLVLAPLFLHFFGLIGIAIEYVVTLVLFVALRYRTLVRIYPELTIDIRRAFTIDEYDRMLARRIAGSVRANLAARMRRG